MRIRLLLLIISLLYGFVACQATEIPDYLAERERLQKELDELDGQVSAIERERDDLLEKRRQLLQEIREVERVGSIPMIVGGMGGVFTMPLGVGGSPEVTPDGRTVALRNPSSARDPIAEIVQFRVGPKPFVTSVPPARAGAWSLEIWRLGRGSEERVYRHEFSMSDVSSDPEAPLPGEPRVNTEEWGHRPGVYLARLYRDGVLWSTRAFEVD